MTLETIIPQAMRKSYDRGHFAPAVKVGGFVFVSGVIGHGDSAEAEFRSAWETVALVLAEAGAGLADIIDSTLYIVDLAANAATMARVKDEFIGEPYPASTWIGVASLIRPNARAEIKIMARVPA
jgi:enamine deaminase RidA (YjgF/YER057c/UK114 family)